MHDKFMPKVYGSKIRSGTATTCATILALPSGPAGITMFCDAATARRPFTANSRPIITTTSHAGTFPVSTREINAPAIKSLSAIGSINLPNTVICLRLRAK